MMGNSQGVSTLAKHNRVRVKSRLPRAGEWIGGPIGLLSLSM